MRKRKNAHLCRRRLSRLHVAREPASALERAHERKEPLKVDLLVRRVLLKHRVALDEKVTIGNLVGWKQDEPRPPVPQRRAQVRRLEPRHESIEMLPVGRIHEVGVGEGEVEVAVRLGALSPDESAVRVVRLHPRSPPSKDLDGDRLGSTIVRDSVDLVGEGEVDGGKFAVVDVAKNLGERLGRHDVDLVEGADRVGGGADLEALRESLGHELGDELEGGRSSSVVGAEEEGVGGVDEGDRVAVVGELRRLSGGSGEEVGRDGKAGAASDGSGREGASA